MKQKVNYKLLNLGLTISKDLKVESEKYNKDINYQKPIK